jgi:hypothetical protein
MPVKSLRGAASERGEEATSQWRLSGQVETGFSGERVMACVKRCIWSAHGQTGNQPWT